MNWSKNPGRVAGFLYLLLLVAPLRLIYIPNTLFVRGDATATANNILAHETLFPQVPQLAPEFRPVAVDQG